MRAKARLFTRNLALVRLQHASGVFRSDGDVAAVEIAAVALDS